jgi:hypothetical protein
MIHYKCKSSISKHFGKFLNALQEDNKKSCNKDITFQIYYDLFRIRNAQWSYKLGVNRGVDYSLSDIFQDIVAHYLRMNLPKEYSVLLECKEGKLRPDIVIKKGDKNWAIIEIKTTIGWNRGLVKSNEYLSRLKALSKQFKVPLKRVFYIFESSRNVNKDFAALFKGKKKSKITKFILPLFEQNAAPYYISKKKIKGFKKYSDKEIFDLYKLNKITDFKTILKRVKC